MKAISAEGRAWKHERPGRWENGKCFAMDGTQGEYKDKKVAGKRSRARPWRVGRVPSER